MQIYMNIMQKFTLKTITESSVQGMGLVPIEVPMRNLGKAEFFERAIFFFKKGNLWQNISIWPFGAAQIWKFATQKEKTLC